MTVFINDFSTHSTAAEHYEWVKECLIQCRQTRIVLDPNRLYLAVNRGILLRHIVSKAGKELDSEKVQVIKILKPLTDVKGIQSVFGHIDWYHNRMKDFVTTAIPLTYLIRKNVKIEYTTECQKSFELKCRGTAYPVMQPPDWIQSFDLYCDASVIAVGVALCQPAMNRSNDHPSAFASTVISRANLYHYCKRVFSYSLRREKTPSLFIDEQGGIFFVDHVAIRYLVNKPELNCRLARCVLLLSVFDYIVQYKPNKMHRQIDCLSRLFTDRNSENINDEI